MSPATCIWWLKNWPLVIILSAIAIGLPAIYISSIVRCAKTDGWSSAIFREAVVWSVVSLSIGFITGGTWLAENYIYPHYIALAERICGCKW